jgi:hypothetical protein
MIARKGLNSSGFNTYPPLPFPSSLDPPHFLRMHIESSSSERVAQVRVDTLSYMVKVG